MKLSFRSRWFELSARKHVWRGLGAACGFIVCSGGCFEGPPHREWRGNPVSDNDDAGTREPADCDNARQTPEHIVGMENCEYQPQFSMGDDANERKCPSDCSIGSEVYACSTPKSAPFADCVMAADGSDYSCCKQAKCTIIKGVCTGPLPNLERCVVGASTNSDDCVPSLLPSVYEQFCCTEAP